MKKQKQIIILLIEDDPVTLEVIRSCLEVYIPDVMVMATTLGQEALRIFKHVVPDLLILDLGLPDISGVNVVQNMRKTSDVPVIIIAKTAEDEEMHQVMKLGAAEDIIEPFDPMDLLIRIDKLLKERDIEPKIRLLPDQQQTIVRQ